MTAQKPLDRLALLLALGQLALGLVWGCFHEIGGFVTEADFYGMYAPGAQALARGEPYVHTRSGPGLSALLALLAPLGVDVFVLAKVVAAASVALLGLAAHVVGSRLASARCGLALQVLVYVVLQRFSFVAGNDVLAASLAWASLALLALRERPTAGLCAAAGLLAGASFLTRYTGLALVAAVAAGLLLLARGADLGARLRASGAFLGAALLAVAPWLIASQVWFGTPLHNKTHALVALEVFAGGGDRYDQGLLEQMEERFGSLGEVLLHDPPELVRYYALDFFADANQLLADTVLFPAYLWLGLGVVLLFARPSPRQWLRLTLALFVLLGFASAALAPYQARYFFQIVPALLLPVALAAVEPWSFAGNDLRVFQRWMIALVLLVSLGGSALKTREYLTSEPRELLGTSAALAPLARPGQRLIARKPHLGFLSGLETIGVPGGDPARLCAWAREQEARFVYVGPWEVKLNPRLAPLAAGRDVPAGLRLVHQHRAPEGCLYALE